MAVRPIPHAMTTTGLTIDGYRSTKSLGVVRGVTVLEKARRLLPRIDMEPAYGWAGTFGESKDSLPYVGRHPDCDPRIHYALGYGANGIPFSAIAAEIVTAAVLGKEHRYTDTFAFDS